MQLKQLLEKLEELVKNGGVSIKYERKYTGKGGFCKYNEKQVIIINPYLSIESKINLFIKELSKIKLENIVIPLEIKKILEKEKKYINKK
ncbi:MAG: hypothetical protein ABIB46_02940, partial [bacterium]